MKSNNVSLWLGMAALLLGSAAGALAAVSSARSAVAPDESKTAARLLRDIRADAVQVRLAATRLDNLTAGSGARWVDYDRQWNEIQPCVEDMQLKLVRLEKMEAAVSSAERKDIDQSKLLIREIRSGTRDFGTLLDKPGVQTTDTKFKSYARSLRAEAGKLDTAASVS